MAFIISLRSRLSLSLNLVVGYFILLNVSCIGVVGQPITQGFISIDCGIEEDHLYTDDITSIPYVSDVQFIDTGTNNNVSLDHVSASYRPQLLSLRSFPSGSRNCYTSQPVSWGFKYLLRASFLYGNYDGLDSAQEDNPIVFDLVLGVNLWKRIKIYDASIVYTVEVLTVAEFDFMSVCLVNINSGTPFISVLELRQVKTSIYQAVNASSSLVLFRRLNIGSSEGQLFRYPEDLYDRIWEPFSHSPYWASISTTIKVSNLPKDAFEVPSVVLQTAVIPNNATSLKFFWDAMKETDDTLSQYHLFMHFAEVQPTAVNRSRTFNVRLNGELCEDAFKPNYLYGDHIYTTSPGALYQYNVSLNQGNTSVLPPILNAVEIYSLLHVKEVATDARDVAAIMAIKALYQVKRNWMGDPCAPRYFVWDGLSCSYTISDRPRIITLILSSSGLTGEIPTALANFGAIKYLDLSYNSLTGSIPNFLAKLTSLQFLNLTGNKLEGSIPPALLERIKDGSLVLSIEGNSDQRNNDESYKRKTKNIPTIAEIVLACALLLLILAVIYIWRMRKREKELASDTIGKLQKEGSAHLQRLPLQPESRQFTYKELENITNNFELEIGKGGFGAVYHGYLDDSTQVAVKMRSQSSSQGSKEFMAEAQLLTRVHHRHLVPLIGYCNDDQYMALVYEFMHEGSLEDHMRGTADNTKVLEWGDRLRIAVEAAKGLEYLHKGCKPPVIHRDVKTSNILLSEKLEAKLADFGLSKSFQESLTHVSTAVVGTVGYLDPYTFKLTEKSDVYSFGVVLLELITGQRAVLPRPEKCHISHWMRQRLANGNVCDFVDERMQEEYDVNSIWKAADIAMKCTAATSSRRPNMAYVVAQLKEALAIEVSQDRNEDMSPRASEWSDTETSEVAHGGRITRVGGPAAR